MLDNHRATAAQEHNVQGLERAGSLAGGALMFTKGLHRGGLIGLVQMAVGGLAVVRGVKGHCATKAWLERHRQEYQRLRTDIQRSAADLKALKSSAQAATEGVTVTGKDPVTGL
ncbi:YgaP-like transmembrane domain [Pseudomonas sp. URMO17WK12:I11]|uniref:YgaP-like transmembrane domain n=1 Tax=Pseudomonas sp. URMO17WK12:I11 TaxID=1283291 RepID=UPI0011A9775C|nr:YgaP-like transmembrane domain [Pseudomonas sp. URMO17WK12:I11]